MQIAFGLLLITITQENVKFALIILGIILLIIGLYSANKYFTQQEKKALS